MSNTNWTKPDPDDSSRRDSKRADAAPVPAPPATEAELEAIRYRGAPLPRTAPTAAAINDHTSPIKPAGSNERTPAGTQGEAENSNNVPETPPMT
jgi:hypothetical protein